MSEETPKLSQGVQMIPIDMIHVNQVSLRGVQSGPKFEGVLAAMKQVGFMGAMTVQMKEIQVQDEFGNDTGETETVYEIIDGLQRYSCALALGMKEVPANVASLNETQMLQTQMVMNLHRCDTKPSEFAEQIKRILNLNPSWTEADMARHLGVSTKYIQDRLLINNIEDENIRALIDAGDIKLTVAYALAQLPADEHNNWLDRALTMSTEEVCQAIKQRGAEIKAIRRQGNLSSAPQVFTPIEHLRKLTDLKKAVADIQTAKKIVDSTEGVEDMAPEELVRLGMLYTIHMDPASIAEARAKHDAETEEKGKKKAKEEALRAERQLAALKKKQEELTKKSAEAFSTLDDDEREAVKAEAEAKLAAELAKKEAAAAGPNGVITPID